HQGQRDHVVGRSREGNERVARPPHPRHRTVDHRLAANGPLPLSVRRREQDDQGDDRIRHVQLDAAGKERPSQRDAPPTVERPGPALALRRAADSERTGTLEDACLVFPTPPAWSKAASSPWTWTRPW